MLTTMSNDDNSMQFKEQPQYRAEEDYSFQERFANEKL